MPSKKLTPSQIKERFPQKRSINGSLSDPYEMKHLRYVNEGGKFKTAKSSETWWILLANDGTKFARCISINGQKRTFLRRTKVFTRRYQSALS